mgnify:FL=1
MIFYHMYVQRGVNVRRETTFNDIPFKGFKCSSVKATWIFVPDTCTVNLPDVVCLTSVNLSEKSVCVLATVLASAIRYIWSKLFSPGSRTWVRASEKVSDSLWPNPNLQKLHPKSTGVKTDTLIQRWKHHPTSLNCKQYFHHIAI